VIASFICLYSTTIHGNFLKHGNGYSLDIMIDMVLQTALGVYYSMMTLLYRDSCILLPVLNFIILFPIQSKNAMYPILKILLTWVAFSIASKSVAMRGNLAVGGKMTQRGRHGGHDNDLVSVHRRYMLMVSVPTFVLTLAFCFRHFMHIVSPTLCLVMASTIINELYYRHRSHKHGNLVNCCHEGVNMLGVVFLPVLVTILILVYPMPSSFKVVTERADSLLPFLTGALAASTAAAYFASIADTWYAVGTGQFQMIALDTLGIAFYFILPLVILSFCFMEKYGTHVYSILSIVGTSLGSVGMEQLTLKSLFDLDNDGYEMLVHLFLVVHIINVITWGIKLVNSQCPIAGYLYGRTYTHGRPNSKKIAICVDYQTLFDKNVDAKERESFLSDLMSATGWSQSSANAVLNINITVTDLLQCRQDIEKLYAQGHELVITVEKNDASHDRENTIRLAYDAYRNVFDGKSPSWYHPTTHHFSAMPKYHSMANLLGLRIAMWSHCICSPEEVVFLKEGLADHNGGLLVYVCNKDKVLTILKSMMLLLRKVEIISATLSSVIPTDNRMDL